MKMKFSRDEEVFRDELRAWLAKNLPDGWLEGNRKLPDDSREYEAFLRSWQRTLYEGGWAAVAWPEIYGGRNASLVEQIIYQQEMARVQAPPEINYVGIHMVAPTLMQIGTEEQKEKYIKKILTGEEIWCQGYSEPNAGSDLSAIETRAVKEGDRWIINGQKVWTSFGQYADRCFLLAKTDRKDGKGQGMTVFLLNMRQEGVETVPIVQLDGEADFNEVYLTDAVAYDEEIVGEINEGWRVMITLLIHERVSIGGQLFTLDQQLKSLLDLVKGLQANGKSILTERETRTSLADLYTRIQGALLNYYRHLIEALKTGKQGAESSIDKLIVSELTKELFNFALSLHGHEGILWKEDAITNHYWPKNFLYSLGMSIGGGTSEVQKNTIGERILGLPKDLGR